MHNAGAQHVIVRYYSSQATALLARAVSLSHLRVSDWMAEGFSGKAQATRAADQPLPKPLSTDRCEATSCPCLWGWGSQAAGTSSARPALRGRTRDRSPRAVVTTRFAGTRTHARAAEPACWQTHACTSRGRRSCKGSAFPTPRAELQPHAALDRSPSPSQPKLFCFANHLLGALPRRGGRDGRVLW